jgi:hypothetical protein
MTGWLLLLALLASSLQQLPPRDALPASATGIVRGRVVSAATGTPLHRVRVTLNGPVQNPPTAVSDVRGEFEILDVPPGTYTITATRAGYLPIQYGQPRPREISRTLRVGQGITIDKVELAMHRGAVLAGQVTDDTGDPAAGVRVEALEHRYVQGRRILVPAKIATTNEIGEYRLSGLEPGAYRVRASSTDVWESDDGKTTHVFAVTYFPGVTNAGQPDAIAVNFGQEVDGLDLRLVPGRAAAIAGVVEDAAGQPLADHAVSLSNITRTIGGRLLSSGQGAPPTRTDARGAFQFSKLPPGEYLVVAGGADERVSETVVLSDGDLRHVTVRPRKPSEVSGKVTTDEGGSPPPFVASRIRIQAVPRDPDRVLPQWGESGGITVRSDFTFQTDTLEGSQLFRVTGLPLDWMLKAVRIGDRDVTDAPIPIRRGDIVQGLEIVLSRKGALIAGEVVPAAGLPASAFTVLAFEENSALWGPGSRFVHATRPDHRGEFTLPALAPGTYRVVAVSEVIEGQWEDAEFLQSLARDGARLELAEGMVEKITLRPGDRR